MRVDKTPRCSPILHTVTEKEWQETLADRKRSIEIESDLFLVVDELKRKIDFQQKMLNQMSDDLETLRKKEMLR